MNTKIQTNLITLGAASGLNNRWDEIAELLLDLCKTYVPGLPNRYKGLRPISAEDVNVPCVMVQPETVTLNMNTTAKYHKEYLFDFWYAVGGSTIDDTVIMATDVAEIFMKLFSNNALGDRGTVGATQKFKTNGSEWIDSEMTRVECSVPFLLGKPVGPKYVSLGNFQLRLQTVTLV